MEWFLNMLRYQSFRFQLIFSKIIQAPSFWLMRPILNSKWYKKRAYKLYGIKDPEKEIKVVLRNPEDSLDSIISGGFIVSLIALILFGITLIISSILQIDKVSPLLFLLMTIPPALYLDYIYIEKKRKYRKYYDKFEKLSNREKNKWAWITFLIIVLVILFVIISFWIMIKLNN